MSTIGRATLQADENGLVTLQCDRCKSRFKIDCSYLKDELKGDICCPVCGISESLNTFWPEEVVEEAKKIAMTKAEQIIADAFKGLNPKFIKVTTKPVQRVDTDITLKDRDYARGIQQHICDITPRTISMHSKKRMRWAVPWLFPAGEPFQWFQTR